ncbi:MAG: cysteine desulfurase [Xanthobacteraceae bacterium]|nr:cysteine desulfurase [Xanthobacteraceae bacterium]
MTQRVYLDWNATTPLLPEARAALVAALDICGNPSSVHGEGRRARRILQDARSAVAAAVAADPKTLTFTSGATESNALALTPGLHRAATPPARRLVVSAVEHSSVRAGGRFPRDAVALAPVDRSGLIDLARLEQLLADAPPALVSVMLANNETGAIQPIREVAALVRANRGILHVDAVAAFGKINIDFKDLGCDLLSVSAHKIGGPKGVGALVVAEDLRGLEPALTGGGQEKGRRAGTENLAGIAGFGAAAHVAIASLERHAAHCAALRLRLERGLKQIVGSTIIFAETVPRLPNTTLFTAPGLHAETAVIAFDLEGIAVSSGSACSSGKVQPSHVLTAMGTGEALASGGIRISLGWETTENDIDRALEAWRKLAGTLVKKNDETVLERF